jgi:hypothetical protein
LLKSAKDLVSDYHLNGDLTVKGGQLTLLQHKQNTITNIHVWTSAFMIFMGVMLEKWPSKRQELLKYMHNVRLAASRMSGVGCSVYDEQYRLRKARFPHSFWVDVDMELWLLYVSTPQRDMYPVASQPSPSSSIHGSDHMLANKKGFVHVPVGASTKGGASSEGVVNSHINVPCVLETTPLQTVTAGKNCQLYSLPLGSSPICVNEVEKSLLLYPLQEVAKELIEGLRFGFKVWTKNSKSVSEHIEAVCRKIKKEITMGRVAGPFNHSPMPTLRIFPIFLTTKNNEDFRY